MSPSPDPVKAIVGSWDLGTGIWVCPGLHGEFSTNLSPALCASFLQLPEPVPIFSIPSQISED